MQERYQARRRVPSSFNPLRWGLQSQREFRIGFGSGLPPPPVGMRKQASSYGIRLRSAAANCSLM